MPLFLEVAEIVAPVFLLAAIGFAWVRRGWAYDVEFVTRLAMTLSIPCLIFMALVRSDVDPRLLRDTVLAALVAYVLVGAVAWGLVRALDLDLPRTFVIVNGMSANTGMPWNLEPGRRIGYEPVDDVARHTVPWAPSSAEASHVCPRPDHRPDTAIAPRDARRGVGAEVHARARRLERVHAAPLLPRRHAHGRAVPLRRRPGLSV